MKRSSNRARSRYGGFLNRLLAQQRTRPLSNQLEEFGWFQKYRALVSGAQIAFRRVEHLPIAALIVRFSLEPFSLPFSGVAETDYPLANRPCDS